MQFERIRKNHKKEIIIGGLLTLGIVSAITLVTTKAKYKLTESIPLVSGTINYKPYDFKTIAMYQSDDGTNYTEINEMPSEGYVVNEEKTYCTTDNKTKVKGKIKTIDGNHIITGLSKRDKCYVWFDKRIPTASETILSEITINDEIPDFSQAATANEGVYKAEDGMYGGTSYYWRGAVTNNYVKFAGFCWRIVRINGDGTLRLIYDGSTCHANRTTTTDSIVVTDQKYYENNKRSEYVGYTFTEGNQRGTETSSNLKIQSETWFNNDSNFTVAEREKVAEGKFCNDRSTASGYSWASQPSNAFYYAGYDRSGAKDSNIVTPTLSCSNENDIYPLKVGAITMDEVILAGNLYYVLGSTNHNYYLYNGQNYWTMTPWFFWNDAGMFIVYSGGELKVIGVSSSYIGIRPVINLRSDITFSSGNGTLNSPYVVS